MPRALPRATSPATNRAQSEPLAASPVHGTRRDQSRRPATSLVVNSLLAACLLLHTAQVSGSAGVGAVTPTEGAVRKWEGTLQPVTGEAGQQFRLTLFSDQDRQLLFLDDTGRKGQPWHRRFNWEPTETGKWPRLTLLYQHAGGEVFHELPPIGFDTSEWSPGLTWESGKQKFRVEQRERKQGQDCWKITGSGRHGPRLTLWIDPISGLWVAVDEVVFMGRGEQYRLRIRRKDSDDSEVESTTASKLGSQADQLGELLRELKEPAEQAGAIWSAEQRQRLEQSLPESVGWLPFDQLLKDARTDLADQQKRRVSLERMSAKALTLSLQQSSLRDRDGKPVQLDDLPERITVLHFWDYRDNPLKPPYGQIGYLDFLHRQRESKISVYGVVVNPRIAEGDGLRQVARSAKQLASFMNLNYSLLFDDGQLLREVGDPRQAAGNLPLFVVLDAERRVVSYHAGLYQVDRDQGLLELSQLIDRLLAKAND